MALSAAGAMTYPIGTSDTMAERALPYPGDDPAQLNELHLRIRDGRQALAHAFDVLSDAMNGLDAAWQGDEADLATGEARRLVSVCRQAALRSDGAAEAVSDHEVTIRQVRARIDALRVDWAGGHHTLATIAESRLTHPATSTLCLGLGGGDLDECGDARQALRSLSERAQHAMDTATSGWRVQVQIAQHSADTCIVALQKACAGTEVEAPGLSGTSIGLAATLGVDGLTFDDRVRARFGRANWNALSASQRAYYLALARAELGPEPVPTGAPLASRWRTLDPLCRLALLHDDPARWGNTDGLPATDRDRANRMALADAVHGITARTAGIEPPLMLTVDPATHKAAVTAALTAAGYSGAALDAARGTLAVNYQLGRAARHDLHGAPVQLLIYQPGAFDGRGRAAIALGDVATADNVAMLVPGMTSNVPDYLDNQVGNALNIVDTIAANDLSSTAAVAYIGYDAPDIDLSVTNQSYSDAGAALVAADVAGMRLMRTNGPAHLTVIGHSYGSTTTSTAFAVDGAGAGPGVTDLVLIGSPGAGRATTAADEGLPEGHVWVGSASSDPVTTIVQQLEDPNRPPTVDCEAGGAGGAAVGAKNPGLGVAAGAVVGCAGGVALGKTATKAVHPDLGRDPAGQAFGGIRFAAETPSNLTVDVANHSLYYDRRTESLSNIVNIVTGHYDAVTTVPTRPEAGAHYDGGDPAADHVPAYQPPGG